MLKIFNFFAQVKWYKDTMLLDPTNTRLMETFGNRHVLTLKNVREVDFGNYSCMADNSLGRQWGAIEVSGRPHVARIVSPGLATNSIILFVYCSFEKLRICMAWAN